MVSSTNESAFQANDGTITFTFQDDALLGGNRTNLEFSIDGGNSWPYNVLDNSGSFTVSNLAPGAYNVWIRWGNNQCEVALTTITINSAGCPAEGGILTGGPFNFCVDGTPDNIPANGISMTGGIGSNRGWIVTCLLYTSPSPRDATLSRMPSSA